MRSVRRSAASSLVPVVLVLAGCGGVASQVAEPVSGPVAVPPAVVPPSVRSIPVVPERVTREAVEGLLEERDGVMSFRPCPGSVLEAERVGEWWLVTTASSGFWDDYRRVKITTRASPAQAPDPVDAYVYVRAQAEVRRPGRYGPGGQFGGQVTILSVSGMRLLTAMCTGPS